MMAVLTILPAFFNEALLYRVTPHHRLERRNAYSVALRAKDWT